MILRPLVSRSMLVCIAALAAHAPQPQEPAALRALDAWLSLYQRGRLQLTSPEDLGNQSLVRRFRIAPHLSFGTITAQRELQILCDAAVDLASPAAAETLLRVASTGLVDTGYPPSMAPLWVRETGEAALGKFSDAKIKLHLMQVARGKQVVHHCKRTAAIQAAAVRALGAFGEPAMRPTIEQQLASKHLAVRVAAASALEQLAAHQSVPRLIDVVRKATEPQLLEAAVRALRASFGAGGDGVSDEQLQSGVAAVAGSIGRTNWHVDMVAVDCLEQVRSARAVPALIAILERFAADPEAVRAGRLSGLLLSRSHEVLRSLTGAFYPMDRPDLWREFWSRVGPTFQVQPAVAANQQSEPHTQANGFFGIPVHGTRVVFVLDLSGSMAFDLASRIPNTGGRPPARLDRAIEELVRAVDGLPEYASFNLVTFANGPKAERWRGDLVAATSANKHLLAKYVKKLRADGGTNTWAGLSDALEIKSAGTDERYDSSVDEVFLLSDGMPSVGRVVDAREILMLVRETNYFSKVRINTVYIADEMTDRDQLSLAASGMPGTEFMERLARENNGTSVRL